MRTAGSPEVSGLELTYTVLVSSDEGGILLDDPSFTDRVRAAHGDAWQEQGRLRRAVGGDVAELPGVRLMATGLPHPQWNNGDVDDPAAVEIDAVRRWYDQHDVPWGVRVPAGASWDHGRYLFGKRLMGLRRGDYRPPPHVAGLVLRAAGPADLEAVLAVDLIGFHGDATLERRWVEPHLHAAGAAVAMALIDETPVGTGYALRADGRAGRTAYVAGLTTLPAYRGRGVAAAMSGWLLDWAFGAGAELAHLHPDTDAAARIYARLGFVEVPGLDIYVDN